MERRCVDFSSLYTRHFVDFFPSRLVKESTTNQTIYCGLRRINSLTLPILPSLHSPPLPDFPRRASPGFKNLVNQGKSPMSPEVPSKAFRASYPGCYQEAVISESGSFRSVGCGPFPATVGFHPTAYSCRCVNHYWQNGLVSRDKLLSS